MHCQVASYRGGLAGDKAQYPLSLFLQRSEPQINPQSVQKTNPYARPTSAQDVEAKMGPNRASTGKSNLSSSSGSSVTSTGSNTSLSMLSSPPSGSPANLQSSPLQTNSFLRPRSALSKQNSSENLKASETTSVDAAEKASASNGVSHQRLNDSAASLSSVNNHSYSDSNVGAKDLGQLKARNTNLMKHFNKLVDSNRNHLREVHSTNSKSHAINSEAATLKDSKSSNSVSTPQANGVSAAAGLHADNRDMSPNSELTGRYILYTSFTRPAPNGINNGKDRGQYVLTPGGAGRAAPPTHKPPIPLRRPPANFTEALNRIEPRPPSDSRPSTSSSTSSGPACAAAEAAAKVRNLNYTPTKPYHEVNHIEPRQDSDDNDISIDKPAGSMKNQHHANNITHKHSSAPSIGQLYNSNKALSKMTPSATPVSNTGIVPSRSNSERTQYYYKGSKAEHRVVREPRPKTEGAVKKSAELRDVRADKLSETAGEWEDMDTSDEDDDNMEMQPDR